MTPGFLDFFKSFYYSNTYAAPVDLSDQSLRGHLLENENKRVAEIAQRLISNRDVQKILSTPLPPHFDGSAEKENNLLKNQGFNLIGSKKNFFTKEESPFYSTIEHPDLEGWIIEPAAAKPEDPINALIENDMREGAYLRKEDALLQIEMEKRIERVAKEEKIDVVIPKKTLVSYQMIEGISDPCQKYCILSKKLNVLSAQETVNAIKGMDTDSQKNLARKIITLIQKVGIVSASFETIRLTSEGKIAILKMNPHGLLLRKKEGFMGNLFTGRRSSVEKCARIGLFQLFREAQTMVDVDLNQGQQRSRLNEFADEVLHAYCSSCDPKFSKWKITLSVMSLGLIPLINAICAISCSILAKKKHSQFKEINGQMDDLLDIFIEEKFPNYEEKLSNPATREAAQKEIFYAAKEFGTQENFKNLLNSAILKQKEYLKYIEGTPFDVYE